MHPKRLHKDKSLPYYESLRNAFQKTSLSETRYAPFTVFQIQNYFHLGDQMKDTWNYCLTKYSS